jgi:hypothetical protein
MEPYIIELDWTPHIGIMCNRAAHHLTYSKALQVLRNTHRGLDRGFSMAKLEIGFQRSMSPHPNILWVPNVEHIKEIRWFD